MDKATQAALAFGLCERHYNLPPGTLKSGTRAIDPQKRDARQVAVMVLHRLGWYVAEIAEHIGVNPSTSFADLHAASDNAALAALAAQVASKMGAPPPRPTASAWQYLVGCLRPFGAQATAAVLCFLRGPFLGLDQTYNRELAEEGRYVVAYERRVREVCENFLTRSRRHEEIARLRQALAATGVLRC